MSCWNPNTMPTLIQEQEHIMAPAIQFVVESNCVNQPRHCKINSCLEPAKTRPQRSSSPAPTTWYLSNSEPFSVSNLRASRSSAKPLPNCSIRLSAVFVSRFKMTISRLHFWYSNHCYSSVPEPRPGGRVLFNFIGAPSICSRRVKLTNVPTPRKVR